MELQQLALDLDPGNVVQHRDAHRVAGELEGAERGLDREALAVEALGRQLARLAVARAQQAQLLLARDLEETHEAHARQLVARIAEHGRRGGIAGPDDPLAVEGQDRRRAGSHQLGHQDVGRRIAAGAVAPGRAASGAAEPGQDIGEQTRCEQRAGRHGQPGAGAAQDRAGEDRGAERRQGEQTGPPRQPPQQEPQSDAEQRGDRGEQPAVELVRHRGRSDRQPSGGRRQGGQSVPVERVEAAAERDRHDQQRAEQEGTGRSHPRNHAVTRVTSPRIARYTGQR